MDESYTISRFEQEGNTLFICINHKEKPVYLEHFFSDEEKVDEATIKDTIENLIAQLGIMADDYAAPPPRVDRKEELSNFTVSKGKIATLKAKIIAEKLAKIEAKELGIKTAEVIQTEKV